jgi:hypothetical protein
MERVPQPIVAAMLHLDPSGTRAVGEDQRVVGERVVAGGFDQ